MPRIVIALVFVTSVCYAAHCPDQRLQQAVIGGDTINGSVRPHHKPLKSAQVRLFSSNGKSAWVGVTDGDGGFQIKQLRPDTYRIEVQGWGSATIRLDATLGKLGNEQVPFWSVQLMDNECVLTSESTN